MGGKKVAIAGLASILVVAMVVAVAITLTKKNSMIDSPTTSNKAVQVLCDSTDYRETCERSLSSANTTDPKELIKLGFEVTIQAIGDVLKNSTLLQQAAKDTSTKDALFVCQDVLDVAIYDLQRSFDKVGELDENKIGDYVEDLRTWLSGVVTNEETCIDAFDNTTSSETAEKMKNLLKTAQELSSNSLAMVTDISSILGQLQLGTALTGNVSVNRKLLTMEEPEWVQHKMRMLVGSRPNAVVALDGSGRFKSINAAINSAPAKSNTPFVIHVKAGLYKEYVSVPKGKNNIVLIGDGPTRTRVTGRKSYAGGVKTFQSCTVGVDGDGFVAKDIAFENTAGPEGHQAVALRASGDLGVFFNVHMDGYQDTLYAHTGRQFYRNCRITGTVDFIFGNALSIFQNCQFIVRKPMGGQSCMVTAQGREDRKSNGAIVIQNGEIRAEPAFLNAKPAFKAYLGRPWKQYSRTIIMKSYIGGSISPQGWFPWSGNFALDTLYYAEYMNHGPGSNTARRVNWGGIKHITPQVAASFTPGKAYGGDQWIRRAGIPYISGMM